MPYVKNKLAEQYFGVHPNTLRKWADTGKIKHIRTDKGARLYWIDEKEEIKERHNYIYTRVSSGKQKDDLKRQVSFMVQQYPNHKVIKDVGSGLNFKRRGLSTLLERVQNGTVQQIVVASKDRLCRFGYELIEQICRLHDTELLVLDQTDKTKEQEFTDDLLSIVQVFCCRWNGKRRYQTCIEKNQIEINITPKDNTDTVVS
jgi:predicted site-specific integrase-resolvase